MFDIVSKGEIIDTFWVTVKLTILENVEYDMRILALIIQLLMLGKVRAGDSPAYPDTCNYRNEAMCGDKCVTGRGDFCTCGSDTDRFRPYARNNYEQCCLNPGDSCTRDRYGSGICSEGRKVSKSSACNATMGPRCYNSYQHSQYIGLQSHYTCPNTCVPWEEVSKNKISPPPSFPVIITVLTTTANLMMVSLIQLIDMTKHD